MMILQHAYEYQLKNGCDGFCCKNFYCNPKNFEKADIKLLSSQLALEHSNSNRLCPFLSPIAFDSSIHIKNQILYKAIVEKENLEVDDIKILKEFFNDFTSFQFIFAFHINSNKNDFDMKRTDDLLFDDELAKIFIMKMKDNTHISNYMKDFCRMIHKKFQLYPYKQTFHFLRAEIATTLFSQFICSKQHLKTFNILVKNILCNDVLLFSKFLNRLPNIMKNFVDSCKKIMTLLLTVEPKSYKSSEFQSICVLLQNISINSDQYKIFFYEMLPSSLDIEHEFKTLKMKKKFSYLYTPAILPLKFKQKCFDYKYHFTQYYYQVTIRRSHILIDSKQFLYINRDDLFFKTLEISFKNEPALDLGGIKREYFYIISQVYMREESNFLKRIDREFYWFNNDTNESDNVWFKLLGVLTGLCLRQKVLLYIKFPILLYKALLNREITIDDLKELYPDVIKNLKMIKQYPSNTFDDLDLRFTITVPSENSNKAHDIPLIENGDRIKVNKENVDDYIKKYCRFMISNLLSENYNNFKDGFYKIQNKDLCNWYSPSELSEIIGGKSDINWTEFKSTIHYMNGYHNNSLTIKYFWDIFEKHFSEEDRKKLLFFITSLKRQPIGGFSQLDITIEKSENIDFFPTSHTCNMILTLPNYQNLNILKDRLFFCINHIEGFGNI